MKTRVRKSVTSKLDRLQHANAVLCEVFARGRHVLSSRRQDAVAEFVLDNTGRVRLIDDYTQRHVLISKRTRWQGYSHGGTMRRLIEALADYIRTDTPVCAGHFGPWPDYICGGDLWGYGKSAMADLRAALRDNPAVAWTDR